MFLICERFSIDINFGLQIYLVRTIKWVLSNVEGVDPISQTWLKHAKEVQLIVNYLYCGCARMGINNKMFHIS